MLYSFHPEAEREFYEAIDYYEDCSKGLGLEFAREVFAAINRILQYPEAWPPYSNRSRRCLCNRFPYAVVYKKVGDEIIVFAVMQLRREPGYAKDRL